MVIALVASVARAQDGDVPREDGVIDAWARAIAEGSMPRWTGPRVAWTEPTPRPADDALVARSWRAPVAVHGADEARVATTLRALETAHAWMASNGWGEPHSDGGRGGGDELDVYLVDALPAAGRFEEPEAAPGESDEVPPRWVRVGWDVPIAWASLDAVTSFATIDARSADLASCAVYAYAQAVLAQQDPAEAPAWRRAIGAFVAWQVTGSFGCAEDAIAAQQAAAHRGLVSHAPGSGEGGAMLLGAISARHDGGSGDFVRDLVQGARQWTWEGEGLRAEPDVWHAVAHFLSLSRTRGTWPRLLEEVAVARYFTGPRAGLGAGAIAMMRDVPGEVPVARVEWARLPRSPYRGELELEPGGSAYVRVDVRGAPEGSRLRVWLRGEHGVTWSMVAVRLDASGRELGRMRTPIRREPRAYLPIELDASVAEVLVVITNVSWRRPDADEPDENVRGFRVVVDRAAESD
ncbi:hypothetical protein DB32_006519 [Sandaracinus amylolyticus]|uniref:Uncharacterized protein n=1 Tax=Sandaracinus amylolyticus TaxID=927083 RepID=A0A0F6YLM8_9BACT|nr:hypothetical protein DB32_006519 [Sandaracinus amylolyticus]